VLALWAGLGYYRRARLLHAAARAVIDRHAGVFPTDPAEIRALPGVGRYTAGAVASLAFGLPEPIVDGNVGRVLLRVHGREGVATDAATQAWAWRRAERLVAEAERAGIGPGLLNEALMELGATVCTPKAARCPSCPVSDACVAMASGRQEEIPSPRPRAVRKVLHAGVVLCVDGRGRRLVEQRGNDGLWAGLWQAPSAERAGSKGSGAWSGPEIGGAVGLAVAGDEPVAEFVHLTTHREVRFRVWAGERARAGGGRVWKSKREIGGLALGTPQRRVLLETEIGQGGPVGGRTRAGVSSGSRDW
jgi:A/G-specific adenine glycosylase